MLLIGWIVYSDWDQDEEDEKGPDDLNQQLDLRKEDKKDDAKKSIKKIKKRLICLRHGTN